MKLLKLLGFSVTAVELALVLQATSTTAFTSPSVHSVFGSVHLRSSFQPLRSTDTNDAAFSAFAETLEEDELFPEDENNNNVYKTSTWQESLEALLDPMTPPAKKQVLLSDLVSANEAIRSDLEAAVRERKLDPILTPTGRKLQDGTRAVARQITNDIIPSIAATTNPNESSNRSKPPVPTPEELPTLVPKIGSQIFDALSTQARKQIEEIQQDLADPSRIPQRISKQTSDLAKEARNVFLETPEGLVSPEYAVIETGDGYEIREYEGYSAASTSMSKIGEPYSLNDLTSSGTAFNALASYIFGANEEGKTLEMTTPVETTSAGEMRFYLKKNTPDETFPTPITMSNEFNEKGAVEVVKVTPALLAVARFTGFTTDGEVSRQKDTLLAKLANDGVELDVPHGAVVPHKIFQYNPPYTIPIVRRNEIAVPVRRDGDIVAENLKKEWEVEEVDKPDMTPSDEPDLAPSDVED